MPIEFRCSQCGQLLRVPESAAGKNARCSKCQALMTVPPFATAVQVGGGSAPPAAHVGVSPPTEPLADLAPPSLGANPFAGDLPGAAFSTSAPKPSAVSPFAPQTAAPSLNPYASPAPMAYADANRFYYTGPRSGLPWEAEPRTLGCWFRTMGRVISAPNFAFAIMRRDGGLGVPLLYNLYAVGMLVVLGLVFFVPIFLLVILAGGGNNRNNLEAVLAGTGIGVAAVSIYGLIFTVIMPLIWAGVVHLMLLVFRAAQQGFETTFRVICYSYFSFVPMFVFGAIPCFGPLLSMALSIWMLVLVIVGLSRAHEISGGKAALAVLTPGIVCCGFYALVIGSSALNGFRN